MENKLLHTFIILAYKESPYLEECINSLKSQTVKSEIIISTSTPSKFLEDISRKHNITLKINEISGGIASDWNFAYRQCNTQYLTLAHQDDIYLPAYTETLINYVEKYPNNDSLILFTGYKELVNDEIRGFNINLFIKEILLFPFYICNSIGYKPLKKFILAFGNSISCPTVTFNKKNTKDIKFSKDYTYNLDWNEWLNLAAQNGSFVYLRNNLQLHRLHSESQTSIQIESNRRHEEEKLIFRRIWGKILAPIIAWFYKSGAKANKIK
jgi:glycosyltransferase involved in cell wall biosynthesis